MLKTRDEDRFIEHERDISDAEDMDDNEELEGESTETEATRSRCLVVADGGVRLDVWLSKATQLSRNQVQKLIRTERVTVDGVSGLSRTIVRSGQEVTWQPEQAQVLDLKPENIPLDIVYQDTDIIILNKQCGLVVHPAAGHATGTLVQALLYHCSDLQSISGTIRPGIVHRLDKDTTGLLVVAKNEIAMARLSQQIKERRMDRFYLALVWGGFAEDSGSIDLPITRHPHDRKRMAVVPGGRAARTDYHVLERFGQWTLVSLKLHSGRTHQIRVHLSHKGHPIVGDPVYGARANKFGLTTQALHAFRLCLDHPRDERRLCWEAELPENFSRVLASLR